MYNYYDAICDDIREYINNEIVFADYPDRDDLEEHLDDALWVNDGVTGNASGSYYCNAWEAEKALAHNWDLLAEALGEFGCDDINPIDKGAEWCDVTIRCYLLGQCIGAVLDEYGDPWSADEATQTTTTTAE